MTRRHFIPFLFQNRTNFRLRFPDIGWVPPDLVVPGIKQGDPAPGARVRIGGPGPYHILFLPEDWKRGASFPLIVEYPGNGPGPFNTHPPGVSVESGTPEDTVLGYGLSGGREFLWLSLPFLENNKVAPTWFGNVEETVDYCRRAVEVTCSQFGGDRQRVLLCGFSRGSLACNYIGLHDDAIAKLWRGFFCHSHYDGVHRWPYPASDRDSALLRLQRLGGRPQFISHEKSGNEEGWVSVGHPQPQYVGSIEETRRYLEAAGTGGDFTFETLPYPNHKDAWILRPVFLRTRVRAWARRVLSG
ncbi:MAG: hypothetical protein HYX25_10910 [Candidatus Solibacter usitatus]|nr:hypothetical protein [Candidatus Solibacter usitatus]